MAMMMSAMAAMMKGGKGGLAMELLQKHLHCSGGITANVANVVSVELRPKIARKRSRPHLSPIPQHKYTVLKTHLPTYTRGFQKAGINNMLQYLSIAVAPVLPQRKRNKVVCLWLALPGLFADWIACWVQ